MKKYLLIFLFLILAAGGIFFFLSGESEEAKVKKVLQTLCRMASKREGDNPAAAALMIGRTDKIFVDQFPVRISSGMFDGTFTPAKMTAELARYRAVFRNVRVRTADMEISFPESGKALVICSGVLDGSTKSGRNISEARDVECYLVKKEETWKISSLVIREILER